MRSLFFIILLTISVSTAREFKMSVRRSKTLEKKENSLPENLDGLGLDPQSLLALKQMNVKEMSGFPDITELSSRSLEADRRLPSKPAFDYEQVF